MIRMFPGPALSQGRFVEQFETELAKFLNVPAWSVVAVSSGTAALHLALETSKPDFKPIGIPATTFIATGNVVKYSGLRPKILDVWDSTWTFKRSLDAPAIAVDLYGVPASKDAYDDSILIEDACESLGSQGVPYAHVSCFSFFANKIITTGGEGGAVVALDKTQADYIRLLRQQGKDYSHEKHQMLGFNYRMTENQARYGLNELPHLPERVRRKREINQRYRELLSSFKFQEDPSGGSNCWVTALVVEDRDELIATLGKHGVEARKVFCSLAEYRWLWDTDTRPETPVADWLADHGLYLPSHHTLTDRQVEYVAGLVEKYGKTIEYS